VLYLLVQQVHLKITASIHCGHTSVSTSETINTTIIDGKLFPLNLKMICGKAFCTQNYSSIDNTIKKGDEILEVNDKDISSLYNQFKKFISVDGFAQTAHWRKMERDFRYNYALFNGQPKYYNVVFKDKNGKLCNAQLEAETLENLTANFKKQNPNDIQKETENIELDIKLDLNTAFLKVRSFKNWKFNNKKKKFKKVLKESFKEINNKKIETLILDLRDNGGGNDRFGQLLLSYLLKEPFTEFNKITLKTFNPKPYRHSDMNALKAFVFKTIIPHKKINDSTYIVKRIKTLKPFQPKSPNFKGEIYVLINGLSFSTTADVASILHSKKRAVFIGGETGGGYRGNSSFLSYRLTLPNSKINVRLPTAHYYTNVSHTDANYGRGTLPDYPIEPNINDVIRGVDTQKDFAIKLIKDRSKKLKKRS